MAKRPVKNKIDPLAIGLELLEVADKYSVRAVRFLYKALGEPFEKPAVEYCEFKIGTKTYGAKLTPNQCQAILNAVKNNGDVTAVVNGLLGSLDCQVRDCANALIKRVEDVASSASTKPIQLGCCHYTGGKVANLSQAQCAHYNPATWDSSDPTCVHGKPT